MERITIVNAIVDAAVGRLLSTLIDSWRIFLLTKQQKYSADPILLSQFT